VAAGFVAISGSDVTTGSQHWGFLKNRGRARRTWNDSGYCPCARLDDTQERSAFMKKRLRIECPKCNTVLSFDEKDVPPGKVVAADCPQCDWTQIFTLEQVQKSLKNPLASKGMFKAFWDTED
jgi:hypothetical protein